ncbi:unnamed protein product [Linum trigynum]|uniref:Uncharacterized protein n=1 Tax=Linum trigynum TaxID=586398 RepID=A0AAV2DYE8_9ROSI
MSHRHHEKPLPLHRIRQNPNVVNLTKSRISPPVFATAFVPVVSTIPVDSTASAANLRRGGIESKKGRSYDDIPLKSTDSHRLREKGKCGEQQTTGIDEPLL